MFAFRQKIFAVLFGVSQQSAGASPLIRAEAWALAWPKVGDFVLLKSETHEFADHVWIPCLEIYTVAA